MANNRWKAKVSDFGSANLKKLAQTAAEGAILYSAPECFPVEFRGPHTPNFPQTLKIDVYSYGVLLCEVITRTLPEELGPLKQKLKSMWPFMHSLVNVCTEYDPNERPTVSHILTELNEPGRRRQVEDQRRAIAPTPRDHDPTRILGIGSMVQVSDPPRYGVLRWIGELPDVKGAIAGVQMVSLLLQTLHMCCSRDVVCWCCAGGDHARMYRRELEGNTALPVPARTRILLPSYYRSPRWKIHSSGGNTERCYSSTQP